MKSEKGNALFLILIAVALFAALSYAVTQSGRGGGGIDREQASINASQVMQILAQTTADLQRFLITSGYNIEDIDLYSAGNTVNGSTDSCTTDDCNLFSPLGGGATVPQLPGFAISGLDVSSCPYIADNKIRPYFFIGSVEGIGSDLPEVMVIYCGVSLSICDDINIKNNVRAASDNAAIEVDLGTAASNAYQEFSGAHTNPMAVTTVNQTSSADTRTIGQYTFCHEAERSGALPSFGNRVLHVLLAR